MATRPARLEDLPELHGIFERAVGELYGRHRFRPPEVSRSAFVGLHAHMLEHDAERFWVAEAEGKPIGFGASIVRDDVWFLSALFVEPDRQASGIGKELLRLAWPSEEAGVRRRLTILDSFQPVSTGLYSHAGLLPVTPVLNLGGVPTAADRPELEPSEPVADDLLALDRAAYGFDRARDHAFWGQEAQLTLWRRDDEPVAYSYRWPSGRVGPVAGRTAEDAGVGLTAELSQAAAEQASLIVPGTAREALSASLAAGLRYTDPPGLLLSTEPAGPQALVPHGYSLF